jgi:hypothetical protein
VASFAATGAVTAARTPIAMATIASSAASTTGNPRGPTLSSSVLEGIPVERA